MRIFIAGFLQPKKKEKEFFGFFVSFFRCRLEKSSDFNVKNEIERITKNSKKNDKIFPKN